ncbi:hypothetical protein A4A49_31554 [Nicotiana attenuata]|uniref:DUF7769 domain-containing protein n=1 Tax=Nicotiana attenuata TaxID=49451 RepID=A0A314LAI3_NICAT|nr:hypothetical protein A4A49_31554 [Nicotiana attenuata]
MANMEKHQIYALQINLNIPLESEDGHVGGVLPDLNEDAFPDLNLNPDEEDDTQLSGELQALLEERTINSEANEELSQPKTKRNLSNDEQIAMYEMLLHKNFNGLLRHGVTKKVATKFSTSTKTVQRIWNLSNRGKGTSETACSKKPRNCGRKRVEINLNQIRDVPLRKSNNSRISSLCDECE